MTDFKTNAIAMLKYQIHRYQAMENGIKCQALQKQLDRLVMTQAVKA